MFAWEIMSKPPVRVGPSTPVREAAALLIQHGFAALPVVDADDQVVGIFTEYDALRSGASAEGDQSGDERVGSYMTTPVEVVSMDTEVAQIARHMLSDRLRCVPVAEDGVLVGVISRRDLLRPMVGHDDEIAARLHELLIDYSGKRDRWDVDVIGGVVTISGAFADEAERRMVTVLANTISGVRRVELRTRI
ncbi:CBS domain-containing protein [Amycolatopsis sp. K13G38]|uniref:CBS domain-containing protein n=1 Tax=Amycolatopsis acididurans TaxID=2724524 RepID=A0ABX1J8E7_9PSEU|nr:CBS domain-containing protein [Amycolatopsis acididurans]NKQ56057.1 CBS domain-containing protein [Amycolatopsis acididurans]